MQAVTIQRHGSYFYTRAYWQVALSLTVIYGGMGAVLAILTDSDLEDVLEEIIYPILAFMPVLMMWLAYAVMLAAFKRDSRTAVQIDRDGVREAYRERERRFIPWAGVHQIEFNADWLGGATLRVRGSFSEIAISNVDLVISRPMRLWQMHRALGRTREMVDLFIHVRDAAPHAQLKLNTLARKRMARFALAGGDAAKR